MDAIALVIGYGVIGLLLAAGGILFGLVLAAYWPFRIDLVRNPPSQLVAPSETFDITLLAGISSRRKGRWHFGLMLISPALPRKEG